MWNDNEKTGRRSLSRPRPESRAGRFCCGRPRRSKRACPSIRCWVASSATVYELDQGTARTSTPHGRAHVASVASVADHSNGWLVSYLFSDVRVRHGFAAERYLDFVDAGMTRAGHARTHCLCSEQRNAGR